MPQLSFVKKFIEQFGGTVPAGDFQMPAGGKCPFGGDVKSESKSTSESHEVPEDMEDEEEDESEASDLELEMEETAPDHLLKPSILYLDECPPKIAKECHRIAKNRKIKTSGSLIKKPKKETKKKKMKCKGNLYFGPCSKFRETSDKEEDIKEESMGYDPLYMPKCNIKMKIDPDEPVNENRSLKNLCSENFLEEEEDTDINIDEGYEKESISIDKESEDNYDDDEPLILLTKRRGRPPKSHSEKMGDNNKPFMTTCREKCLYQCNKTFTQNQRLQIYDFYWSLSKDKRIQYIRKHILAKRYSRLKRNKPLVRGSSYCYYLDVVEELKLKMQRVCRIYFEGTLGLTNHRIKKALEGHKLELEHEMVPLWQQKQEKQQREDKTKSKEKERQQMLDPVTGDLVTIDPKEKKFKLSDNDSAQGCKKKKRRKADDPLPEHFPKPINCEIRCIFKCHTLFSEEERKKICDIFWSLDYIRRKDFVLSRVETKEVQSQLSSEFRTSTRGPRAYQTKCYLRSGPNAENKRVCKHFLLSTLCIDRKFIENATEFADKTTGFYTGRDRRGFNSSLSKTKSMCKKDIYDHISSYCTWVPNKKSKHRYLHHKLSIKLMYNDYKEMCLEQQREFVSSYGYYKSFHADFRLLFLRSPGLKPGRGFNHLNPNISQYTGEEPGGFWQNSNGERLDTTIRNFDFTKNIMRFPKALEEITLEVAEDSKLIAAPSIASSTVTTTLNANPRLNCNPFMDPSSLVLLDISAPNAVKLNLNLNSNNFLGQDISPSSTAVFRKL